MSKCIPLKLDQCFVADVLGETFEDDDYMCRWCVGVIEENFHDPIGSGGTHNPSGVNHRG